MNPIFIIIVFSVTQAVPMDIPENIKKGWGNITPQSAIETLGVEVGSPITNGFVFIDGKYIPPPYIVKREGNGIFINSHLVEERMPWPIIQPTPDPIITEKPQRPASITETTPSSDRVTQMYIGDMQLYYTYKYGEAEVVKHMIALYQSLPCIEKVLPDTDPGRFTVYWKGSNNQNGVLMRPIPLQGRRAIEWTPEEIITRGKSTKESYEDRLNKNGFFILSTIQTRFGRTTGTVEGAVKILPFLISILETSQNFEEVYEKITALNIAYFNEAKAKAFFENRDSITPELKQRVEALRLEQEERAKRLQKLREEPKPKENQKLPDWYNPRR